MLLKFRDGQPTNPRKRPRFEKFILPASPGMEGAGIVEDVGEGVTEVAKGDRVAYAGLPPGAYAEVRLIPAHRLVKIPESISTHQAAAMMLQGMTARYLLHGCFQVKSGDHILYEITRLFASHGNDGEFWSVLRSGASVGYRCSGR